MMKKMLMVMLPLFALACAADEINLGATAPSFSLVNAADSKTVKFTPGDGKLSVVVFTCNQCPYAKAFEPRLIEIAKRYQSKGVSFYAIDSNDDSQYDVETLANMRDRAVAKAYPYPYLKDGDSKVAHAYGARVTPHVFVVDGKGAVRYRGYVDDSARPEERTNTGLTNALDALLANQPVQNASTRAFGCGIKWRS
jgi:thiol-disulfide isomerase/thioredoxin